jgi:hypothetical protein
VESSSSSFPGSSFYLVTAVDSTSSSANKLKMEKKEDMWGPKPEEIELVMVNIDVRALVRQQKKPKSKYEEVTKEDIAKVD